MVEEKKNSVFSPAVYDEKSDRIIQNNLDLISWFSTLGGIYYEQ